MSNKLLGIKNTFLQSHYLKQKNSLQDKLINEFSQMIEILPKDDTGFASLALKEEYQFQNYKDACHIIGEESVHA
jgi:hypothetical protein